MESEKELDELQQVEQTAIEVVEETVLQETAADAEMSEIAEGVAEQNAQSGVQKAMAALSDDDAEHVSWSFDSVLNGDILDSKQIRRQVPFVIMVIIMLILYVSNRYNAQQEMINIDNLKVEKNEMRYRATARSSQLLQRSRESQVVEYFRNTPDSTLNVSEKPPFIIYKSEE